jgi:hypothetical protein
MTAIELIGIALCVWAFLFAVGFSAFSIISACEDKPTA